MYIYICFYTYVYTIPTLHSSPGLRVNRAGSSVSYQALLRVCIRSGRASYSTGHSIRSSPASADRISNKPPVSLNVCQDLESLRKLFFVASTGAAAALAAHLVTCNPG